MDAAGGVERVLVTSGGVLAGRVYERRPLACRTGFERSMLYLRDADPGVALTLA